MTGSSDFGHAHGGLDLGVGHAGVGHGVADLHFGHGGHAGEVTRDAIIVGHAFPNAAHAPHITTSVADAHGVGGVAGLTMDGIGPSFDVPIESGRTNYAILVVGLGACDFETMVRRELLKQGVAECFNLQLPNPRVSPPRRYEELLPVNFRNPSLKVTNPVMSKGFYPGATGSTTIWRINGQIGERSTLAAMTGRPAILRRGVYTYLEIEVTMWSFYESGDYEIRLVVRVVGGKDSEELVNHIKVARDLCKTMLKAFKSTSPSSDARKWREQAAAGR